MIESSSISGVEEEGVVGADRTPPPGARASFPTHLVSLLGAAGKPTCPS